MSTPYRRHVNDALRIQTTTTVLAHSSQQATFCDSDHQPAIKQQLQQVTAVSTQHYTGLHE